MQIVGGLYMVYLAYQIYKMGTTEDAPKQVTGFWNGFIMQFVNPRSLVYFHCHSKLCIALLSKFIFIVPVRGAHYIHWFLAYSSWVVFGTVFRTLLNATKNY